MARKENSKAYATGSDAAYIKPRLIPGFQLQPRDDSGGPDYNPYAQEWGDGGYVTGDKKHLSAYGGADDDEELDEVSAAPRSRDAVKNAVRASVNPPAPAKSRRLSRET